MLEIVDADRLAGLSRRKLAAELGVQASVPYSDVKTKDDLLHEIGTRIMWNVGGAHDRP